MASDEPSPKDFLALIEAMFKSDERSRLVGSAPVFYLLRTPQTVICRFHADLEDEFVLRLKELSERKRGRPAQWQCEYGDYLSALGGLKRRISAMRAGPLYVVPGDVLPGGICTAISESNSHLLSNGLEEWLPAVSSGLPLYATIVDDCAVAVCTTVCASQKAHCAGVETVVAYRGQGFAANAVAGWACAVRASGATPFYGTTFDNISSQRVARRLNMSLVGSEFSVRCESTL